MASTQKTEPQIVPGASAGEYWVTSTDPHKEGTWYRVQGVDARIRPPDQDATLAHTRCSCPAGRFTRNGACCAHRQAAVSFAVARAEREAALARRAS